MKTLFMVFLSGFMISSSFATKNIVKGQVLVDAVDTQALTKDQQKHFNFIKKHADYLNTQFEIEQVTPSEFNLTYKGETANIKLVDANNTYINGKLVRTIPGESAEAYFQRAHRAFESSKYQSSWLNKLETLLFPKAEAIFPIAAYPLGWMIFGMGNVVYFGETANYNCRKYLRLNRRASDREVQGCQNDPSYKMFVAKNQEAKSQERLARCQKTRRADSGTCYTHANSIRAAQDKQKEVRRGRGCGFLGMGRCTGRAKVYSGSSAVQKAGYHSDQSTR